MNNLKITSIEVDEFKFPLKDVTKDYNGFNLVYKKKFYPNSGNICTKSIY